MLRRTNQANYALRQPTWMGYTSPMDVFSQFHPLIATWFSNKYQAPTDIQEQAWPKIHAGKHLLITAPTGSGKTLTAFLCAINQFLIGEFQAGTTQVLYISPLKALNNDIQRNLIEPLTELRAQAEAQGIEFPVIRVQTRSGDTDQSERQRMLRKPPEILITTPESLNLMLSSRGGSNILQNLETVILDEIHAVVGNKRGVYLMSAIERLVPLSGEFQRISLSATVQPLDTVAKFVAGYRRLSKDRFEERSIETLQSQDKKTYEVSVRYPENSAQRPVDEKIWDSLVEDFVIKIRNNRATLLFVNSRTLCEKLTYKINTAANEMLAYAHHGSLAREIRFEVEQRLKAGDLRAIVATGTLEMGIDIGYLDEVILIQSPDSVSSAIQRIGRAGHGVGETSRCTIYPTHPNDFIEAAVLSKAVLEKDIEPIHTIDCPLDILAQAIVSMAGTKVWQVTELFFELRRSTAFNNLTRPQFDLILNMLAGRYEDNHIQELKPKIIFDRDAGTIESRRGAMMALYLSGGVIPDRGYYQIRHEQGNARIGDLDEEFVWEAYVGQVFAFGTQHWQVTKITHNDVVVRPAKPTMLAPPFWRSEGLNRDFHFADRIGQFLEQADELLGSPSFKSHLKDEYHLQETLATELVTLLAQQKQQTRVALPHRHHLLIERTQTSPLHTPGQQVVLHTGWGSEVNRPLALAIEAGWQRKWGEQPEVWVSDQCLIIQLSNDISTRDLFDLVPINDIELLLRERLEGSGYFGARFRENAGRALLLSKGRFNERKPLWMSRLQSQKLLDAVLKFEDFPILLETWRSCLRDDFDLENLRRLLNEVETGEIAISEVKTEIPSPFARTVAYGQINSYMYKDDQPKSSKVSQLNPNLLEEVVFQPGLRPAIPTEIILEFLQKRQRTLPGYGPESEVDLVEWVKERTAIPLDEWPTLLAGLRTARSSSGQEIDQVFLDAKLTIFKNGDAALMIAREDEQRLGQEFNNPTSPDLANWLQYYGPLGLDEIHRKTGIPIDRLTQTLSLLLDDQTVIVGPLVKSMQDNYWCEAENYEVLLRFVRRAARVDFQPLQIEALTPFLYQWQTGFKHQGEQEQLFETIERLRNLPLSAALWEKEILPSRLGNYRTQTLDLLFQQSKLYWIGDEDKKIQFCFKEDLDLLVTRQADPAPIMVGLIPDKFSRYDFSALLDMSGLTVSELSRQIWRSVWRGEISNDTLLALRAGIQNRFTTRELSSESIPTADLALRHLSPHPARRSTRRSARAGFGRWRDSIPFAGNWFQLNYPDRIEDLLETEELNKDQVRLLLDRYGIIFRELLLQEAEALQWRILFRSLRLMELSGEVHSGYFFSGIPGPQFISSVALRQIQRFKATGVYWLNAVDPISSCGLAIESLKGSLPRRILGNHITYDGADIVLISERQGKRLQIFTDANQDIPPAYFGSLRHLLFRSFQPLQKITVETINGEPARTSPYLHHLEKYFELVMDHKSVYLQKNPGSL